MPPNVCLWMLQSDGRNVRRGDVECGGVRCGRSPVNLEASSGPQSKRTSAPYSGLVIDCHGHYTTEPPELSAWRKQQIDAIGDAVADAEA